MSSQKDFIKLLWFEKDMLKFECYKLKDDEVYKIIEYKTFNINTTKAWNKVSEKYMTRDKYSKFLSIHGGL